MVDARDSKSRAARRAGSIPALGTKLIKAYDSVVSFFYVCAVHSALLKCKAFECLKIDIP